MRGIIVSFFFGLLVMAIIAIGVDQVCEVTGGWGSFNLGWLNPAIGVVLTTGGSALVVWSVLLFNYLFLAQAWMPIFAEA